jgi:hypothetical protein
MSFSLDMAMLLLYLMQQLGMMLGVGSQIILLMSYLLGKRDGTINTTEDAMAHSVYRVLWLSLFLIISSGAAITAFHFWGNQASVVVEPAFLMKWQLIVTAVVLAGLLHGSKLWNKWLEGLSGANWGALFLIHIFAPVTTYSNLLMLYAEWIVGFYVVWMLLVFALRPKVLGRITIAPKAVPAAAVVPPKVVVPKPIPANAIRLPAQPKPTPVVAVAPPPKPMPVVVPPPPKPALVAITPPPPPPPMRPAGGPPPAPMAILKNVALHTPPPPPPPANAPAATAIADPDHQTSIPPLKVMPRNQEELDGHISQMGGVKAA